MARAAMAAAALAACALLAAALPRGMAQPSLDYNQLGTYDYDLHSAGQYWDGYDAIPDDEKNYFNPYMAYYGDEYGDFFFTDSHEHDCTVGKDGKPTFEGTPACDLRLTGADKAVPNLTGGLDGVYKVVACESGRPMYKRNKSPQHEERVLWYSTMFKDWDITNGTAPKNDDVLMYGGRGGEESRPQYILTDWHVASEFMKDFKGFEEYGSVAMEVVCADGSKSDPAPLASASMSKGFGSTPLLSDDEMEKQYSSVYQRAKARRSSVGAGTFAVAGLFGILGLAVVFGVPYLLAKARLSKKSV